MDIGKAFRKLKKSGFLLALVIPVIFLVVGTATLKDYGINWDEPFHFIRGQAYLHYFLTGEKNYLSLPPYPQIARDCFETDKPRCTSPAGPADRENFYGGNLVYEDVIKGLYPKGLPWRSYYQNDNYTFDEIVKMENGHPPASDILSALFNFIFYQRLHLFGDIESYHLFEVFASFLIVFGVALVVYYYFGSFASVVASFSLAAYPLFFAESHFNIKDPPETAFYGLTILTFYFGVVRKNWKLLIASSVFAALALGTKFNAFFLIPTLGVWFIFDVVFWYLEKRNQKAKRKDHKFSLALIVSLVIYPFLVVGIFWASWPYLWQDPLENFLKILDFYRQIGLGTPPELSKFLVGGINTYPILWIFYTTPIPILFLFLLGMLTCLFRVFYRKDKFALLVLVWFWVPIIRVSLPRASIYGGVRQIMEFIPPLAIMTGMGAFYLVVFSRKYFRSLRILPNLLIAAIFSSIFFVTYEMIRIHPNQNVYFNQIIGGLPGAKEKNIPYWGNSYGNAYQQGIKWLNQNAEPNAKLGLPIGKMGNIPRLKLRSDIDFDNSHWSGPKQKGEYEIELFLDWFPVAWYSYAYYDIYLEPVYEVKVEGVPLLKIWKNEPHYLRKGFEKEIAFPLTKAKQNEGKLVIDLGKSVFLTKLVIQHAAEGCTLQRGGYIAISEDGSFWTREPEPIDYPQVPPDKVGWDEETFVFLFAAKKAKYILIDTLMKDSCYLKQPQIEVWGLAKLP